MDLLDPDKSDSVAIKFYIGPSITNHTDTMVEKIVKQAVEDWECYTLAYFHIGGASTIDNSIEDGFSVIHLIPLFADSTSLAVTSMYKTSLGVCYDYQGNTCLYP